MKTVTRANGQKAAVLTPLEKLDTPASVLDLMGEAWFEGCAGMIVPKECLPESFFDLKTGFAGEVLQKFSNYRMKIAVIGDFSSYSSKSLKDFMYECNKGSLVFFKKSEEEGIDFLLMT
jgi:hypothetical protein